LGYAQAMQSVRVAFVVLVWGFVFAQGSKLADAQALYAKGAFLEASQVAASLETAEGYALAARALSWHAGSRPDTEQDDLYTRCEQYARKAIKRDPKYAPGYFELGAAIGQLGSNRGAAWAFANGVATQVKENFERAIQIDPKLVVARVALGRWHAEIVAHGVGFLFGGNADEATKQFEESVRLEPKSIMVHSNYARMLLTLDKQKNRDAARAQLEIAIGIDPRDVPERLEQEGAKRLLQGLK
jgi:tetratricopeptide (TPR) repeat protein